MRDQLLEVYAILGLYSDPEGELEAKKMSQGTKRMKGRNATKRIKGNNKVRKGAKANLKLLRQNRELTRLKKGNKNRGSNKKEKNKKKVSKKKAERKIGRSYYRPITDGLEVLSSVNSLNMGRKRSSIWQPVQVIAKRGRESFTTKLYNRLLGRKYKHNTYNPQLEEDRGTKGIAVLECEDERSNFSKLRRSFRNYFVKKSFDHRFSFIAKDLIDIHKISKQNENDVLFLRINHL